MYDLSPKNYLLIAFHLLTCRVDKESKFKVDDYEFMKKLRSSNSQNREMMSVKLTQKLLESKRNGRKQSIVDLARRVSSKMSISNNGQAKPQIDKNNKSVKKNEN